MLISCILPSLGLRTLGLVLSSTEKKLEKLLFKMCALFVLVSFSNVDLRGGDTPILSFHLFLINEKKLGLILGSCHTDNCS